MNNISELRDDIAKLHREVARANAEIAYLKGYTSGLAGAAQVNELGELVKAEFAKINKAAMFVLISLVIGLVLLLI